MKIAGNKSRTHGEAESDMGEGRNQKKKKKIQKEIHMYKNHTSATKYGRQEMYRH